MNYYYMNKGVATMCEANPNELWVLHRFTGYLLGELPFPTPHVGLNLPTELRAAEQAMLDFWYAYPASEEWFDTFPCHWQFFQWLAGTPEAPTTEERNAAMIKGGWPEGCFEDTVGGNFAILDWLRWHTENGPYHEVLCQKHNCRLYFMEHTHEDCMAFEDMANGAHPVGCHFCGAVWVQDSPTESTLHHAEDCRYLELCNAEDNYVNGPSEAPHHAN